MGPNISTDTSKSKGEERRHMEDSFIECPKCQELLLEPIDEIEGFCHNCQEYITLPDEEE